jgi:tripartite-type tricarboxylate transporter receptor subunit TctC
MNKLLILAAALTFGGSAMAQNFPSRPLHIVVPNPAGGTVDIVARAVQQGLAEKLGQPVIIDLKPGGNNVIGTEFVARAAPDGYTILLGGTHLTINPLVRKLPYDGLNAFAPVALLAATPNVIAVNPSVAANTIQELIALAKARPNRLNFATSPTGNGIYLAGERFKALAGIEMNSVPYQGGVQAALAVAGGHAEVLIAPLSDAAPHVASGKLRVLAVTSAQRVEMLREVPTLAESGLTGFQAQQWFGAFVPAGTPQAVIERLSATMREALEKSAVRTALAKIGVSLMPLGPDELAKFLKGETLMFAEVIRQAGIKPE